MKTTRLSLLTMLLIAPLFVSCNKAELLPEPQEEETIVVPITLAGIDLEVGQEPMTKANEATTYFIAVKQDGSPYAWYCMDSFDNVSVSLVKGHKYDFQGYVAYDIKGIYYWKTLVGNLMSNGYSNYSNGIKYDSGYKYSIDNPLRTYNYKMLVCSESFDDAPESVTLNMYNAYFGIKANVSNLKGTLSIVLGDEYNHSIQLTEDNPTATQIFHFTYPLNVLKTAKNGQEYITEVSIDIKYTNDEGTTSVLHSGKIAISRLKYTTLNIKLSDHAGAQQAVSLSMEESYISNGESIDFEF